MGAIGDLFGNLLRTLLLALLIITALGLFSTRPGASSAGASFACPALFAEPEINRLICKYHPARIWNTPVTDLVPGLGAGLAPEGGNVAGNEAN